MSESTKKCPYCAEEIKIEAIKCKHCNELLNGNSKSKVVTIKDKQSNWLAAVLSLIIPWLWHIYKWHIGLWLFLFIITIIWYFVFIVPWLLFHFISVMAAAKVDFNN